MIFNVFSTVVFTQFSNEDLSSDCCYRADDDGRRRTHCIPALQ